MLFNSGIFVFIFLPISVILYYLMHSLKKHKLAMAMMVLCSWIFYGYNNWKYLVLFVISIMCNYGIYTLRRYIKKNGVKKAVLGVGVILNLAMLFYFKYMNFFITTCNSVLKTDFVVSRILLPLGISFFTFQQISFLIDSYSEDEHYSLLEYCAYVSFYPQLVAGPIVLHNEFIPQIRDEKRYQVDWRRFSEGLRYFIIGLSKKVLIADSFALVADSGFIDQMGWDTASSAFIIVSYMFQLYFDFSGYSDMAMGIGKMFGIDLPVNFDSPLKAKNQGEVWKRWHITLMRFLSRYVYYPLGGSRKGVVRKYINIMIVFLLSGIWHGAGWTFIAWGVICGILNVSYRIVKKVWDKIPGIIQITANFGLFAGVFAIFRASYLGQAVNLFKCLLNVKWNESFYILCENFAKGPNNMINVIVSMGALLITSFIVWGCDVSHKQVKKNGRYGYLWYGFLLAASISTFSNVSSFIYFIF